MRSLPLIACLLLALCACQSYKAGGPTPAATSVWVAPVTNESTLPQIQLLVSERLRDDFMSDQLVRLVTRDTADTHLEVTISDFTRQGRAQGLPVTQRDAQGNVVQEPDTGVSRAFDLFLHAHVRLVNSSTGAVVYEDDFTSSTQSIPSPYFRGGAEEERLMLPILARDLARQIHDAVSSRWETPTPLAHG